MGGVCEDVNFPVFVKMTASVQLAIERHSSPSRLPISSMKLNDSTFVTILNTTPPAYME